MSLLYFFLMISHVFEARLAYKNFLIKDRLTNDSRHKNVYHLITEYFDTNATIIVSHRGSKHNMESSIGPDLRLHTEEGGLITNQSNANNKGSSNHEYVLSYQSQCAYRNFRMRSYEDLYLFIKNLKVISSNECKWTTANNYPGSNVSQEYTINPPDKQKKPCPVPLDELVSYLMENPLLQFFEPEQFSQRSTGIFLEEVLMITESRYEYACISKEKNKYYIKAFPLSFNGSVRIVISITDISSHVLNARLMSLDKQKDQILAMVTHDLRNPLSVIKNNLEFIKQEMQALNTQSYEQLNIFLKNSFINCKLLETLINDILDYAQIKNGKMKMSIEKFCMRDVLDEIWFMFSTQFEAKNKINFSILCDNTLPQFINNDRERFKQVLINLLSNSLKFTSKGSVTLTLSSKKHKIGDRDPVDLIRVQVSDTGSGIPANVIPQLFKPYSTFGNEEEHNTRGIGLGLLICKKLVSRLGPTNKIFVKSKENHGTTFWFYISITNDSKYSSFLRFRN